MCPDLYLKHVTDIHSLAHTNSIRESILQEQILQTFYWQPIADISASSTRIITSIFSIGVLGTLLSMQFLQTAAFFAISKVIMTSVKLIMNVSQKYRSIHCHNIQWGGLLHLRPFCFSYTIWYRMKYMVHAEALSNWHSITCIIKTWFCGNYW